MRVLKLIEEGRYKEAKKELESLHPSDIARIISHADGDKKIEIFKLLDVDKAADTILELDDYSLHLILKCLSEREISELASEMDIDDAVDLVEELPSREREKVVGLIEEREKIEPLLSYPPATAGGLMRPDFPAVPENVTVGRAVKILREKKLEDFNYVYVVDRDGKLKGWVTLHDLILSDPKTRIKKIKREPVTAHLLEDQEEVARKVAKYDLLEIPVVDSYGRIRGVVTVDDIVDVIEEEATEDMLHFGGLDVREGAFTPPIRSFLLRLPWLYINLITATIASVVVSLFRDVIGHYAIAAAFMPVVAGMGGNVAIQTLTIVVRAIAMGEITVRDAVPILLKKCGVSLLLSIAVGVFVAINAYLLGGNPVFGLIVWLSIGLNFLTGAAVGVLIPILLKQFGLDPALGSNIIITAITDIFGYFTLFGLVRIFL